MMDEEHTHQGPLVESGHGSLFEHLRQQDADGSASRARAGILGYDTNGRNFERAIKTT